jgi:leucine dehydrogenase
MTPWSSPEFDNHEQVSLFSDVRVGLRAVIAIHSTALGSAVGGTRIACYDSQADAVDDALRLSKAMSYKSALAGLPFGGGKAVIIGDANAKKSDLLERYAGWVNSFGGRFCTGEDVGVSVADCEALRKFCPFVVGTAMHGTDDTARCTALGVFYGMQAAIETRLQRRDFDGLRVAVQGVGSVGWELSSLLWNAGARLTIADVRQGKAHDASRIFLALVAPPEIIHAADVDVFAPCALGKALKENMVDSIKAKVIAGCANNQLESRTAGEMLRQKAILYSPDFVINAGGLISAADQLATMVKTSFSTQESVNERLQQIYFRLRVIFGRANVEGRCPEQIAEDMALEHIQHSVLR